MERQNEKANRLVLVVVDLVQDYFDPVIWPDSAIPGARGRLVGNTNELVGVCRSAEIPVVWIRQQFKPDLSDAFPHMRDSGKSYAVRGTPGCQLLPELDVAPDDSILTKNRFSAFFKTDLETTLKNLKCQGIILAGITTAWCIRSTAVDAYQLGYDVILAHECMQAFTVDDHLSSVQAMDGYISRCLSNAEIGVFL